MDCHTLWNVIVLHWYLTACLTFLHLYFCCGFVWTASQLWIGLVHACVLFSLWCILNRICWSLCDNVATSFLNIATSGLLRMIILTSPQSSNDGIFQNHIYAQCFYFYIAVSFLAPIRLLLENAVGLSMYFLALCLWDSWCCFLFIGGQLLIQIQTHLFLCIVV